MATQIYCCSAAKFIKACNVFNIKASGGSILAVNSFHANCPLKLQTCYYSYYISNRGEFYCFGTQIPPGYI